VDQENQDGLQKQQVKSNQSDKCKFGSGQQVMAECRMIYIHVQGYYPSDEDYRFALKHLCPNLRDDDEQIID
jgi:hypothetical protein